MEDLNKIATEIALHTENMLERVNYQLKEWNRHQGKSRAGSTPYASKRKKKRKKRK